MNDRPTSVSQAAFERLYQEHSDPWNFAGSTYERERYALTLDALRRDRYGSAFEPGCSIGELTVRLAARCRDVVATDISPTAAARARDRCAHLANVSVQCRDLASDDTASPLDLVVFSEVGYYFDVPRLIEIARRLAARLQMGGEFVAVHWLGSSPDHVLHGDRVHDELKSALGLTWHGGARYNGFRIDTWGAA